MSQITPKVKSTDTPWSLNLRPKVTQVVKHNSLDYINLTGKNSEPGVGSDWKLVSSGGSGSSSFTGLSDTPNSLGTYGQVPAVNSAGNALEFVTPAAVGYPTTSFTAVLSSGKSLGVYQNGDTVPSFTSPTALLQGLGIELILPNIISNNSVNLTGATGLVETGVSLTNTLSATFTRGLINNANGAANTFLTGPATSTVFSGTGINSSTGVLSLSAPSGQTTWTVVVNYSQGTDNYFDSTGAIATNLNAQRVAGSVQDTLSRTSVFPFFHGMVSADLTSGGTVFYGGGLTKLIQSKSNKNIALNGSNEFIYYGYPASYGTLTSIVDGNGFNVTSSFTPVVVDVTSTGLGANYTESYRIYRTDAVTTVAGQTFQFNF